MNGDDQLPDREQHHSDKQDAADHCQQHHHGVGPTAATLWRWKRRERLVRQVGLDFEQKSAEHILVAVDRCNIKRCFEKSRASPTGKTRRLSSLIVAARDSDLALWERWGLIFRWHAQSTWTSWRNRCLSYRDRAQLQGHPYLSGRAEERSTKEHKASRIQFVSIKKSFSELELKSAEENPLGSVLCLWCVGGRIILSSTRFSDI